MPKISANEEKLFRLLDRICGALQTGNEATIQTTLGDVRREAKQSLQTTELEQGHRRPHRGAG